MNFYRSLYDLASILPEKGRRAILVAMLDYFFEGIEPDKLTANERKAFEAVRGRIDASRVNGNNRRNKKRNENGNAVRNETHNETRNESNNENLQIEAHRQKSPSLSPSPNPFGVGVQGEGTEPPEREEVEAYFAANCHQGSWQDFFDTYASQGWVKGNGQPIADWRPLALKWSRNQRDFDQRAADRRPREEPPKPIPKAVNYIDWEAEAERLQAEYQRKWGDLQ